MANDGLNQLGKYIKKTRDDSNYALNRYLQRRASVERVRDVFDPINSFTMKFRTREGHERAVLDLRFDKPPPTRLYGTSTTQLFSCGQSFTVGTSGALLTLATSYVSDSLTVFMNGALLSDSQYAEIDPDAGQVYVNGGPRGSNTVVICYTSFIKDCTAIQFDDFNRTVTDGLGYTLAGYPWVLTTSQGTGSINVDGSSAYIVAGTDTNPWPQRILNVIGKAPATLIFSAYLRFKVSSSSGGGIIAYPLLLDTTDDQYGFDLRIDGDIPTLEEYENFSPYDSWQYSFASDGYSEYIAPASGFSVTPGSWYRARIDITADFIRGHIWADTDSEPTGWGSIDRHGDYTSSDPGIGILNGSTTVGSVSLWVDYIDFDYGGKPCT